MTHTVTDRIPTDPLFFDQIEREARRLRAEAQAEMISHIRGWFAARRAARRAGHIAAKTRAA